MTVCPTCASVYDIGDWPWCPHERSALRVVPDTIPGGLYIETLDATVHSHSERKNIMRAKGLQEAVRHIGVPGSDKSPHTTRWT